MTLNVKYHDYADSETAGSDDEFEGAALVFRRSSVSFPLTAAPSWPCVTPGNLSMHSADSKYTANSTKTYTSNMTSISLT